MRKFLILSLALLLTLTFASNSYAFRRRAVDINTLEANFEKARETYIAAKQELSDAQINSLLTFGKEEKQEAVSQLKEARMEVKDAKKAYKQALNALHKAELARDAKIDRSPWN